jgi:hypothetical protein
MKSIKVLIIVLLVPLSILCYSQNSGYLGRKIILSTGVRGMPFIGRLGVDENMLDFNLRWSTNAEFVVGKKISLGYVFERVSDKVILDNLTISEYLPIVYYNSGVPYNSAQEIESPAFFKGNNHGFFIKFFRNRNYGSIAPIGHYFIIEYFFNRTHIKDDGRFLNNGTNTLLHTVDSRTLTCGMGFQNVYYKYLIMGIQFELGYNRVGYRALADGDDDNPMFYRQEAKLFSDNLVVIKFNVGWLLY